MSAAGATAGERAPLAIVLHTHMPYVKGYGTWPFGEEWLWEVYASSYVPVTELIRAGAPLTLSLTPVLADQYEAPASGPRCRAFLDGERRTSHAEDQAGLRAGGLDALLAASEHSWLEYERAIAHIDAAGGNLLGALAATSTWTSAATHAVLPLLATEAGVRLQVGTGAASHRRRAGRWGGGFWLPEGAWDPELEAPLIEEGVRTVCVELTGEGPDDVPAPRAPWRTRDGLRILPIDRPLIDAVWHHEGYPAHADYRSSHARSYQGHALWNNAHEPYDPAKGAARARADAADWARRCADALSDGIPRVVAFDTELFGHWWHEGPAWLERVLELMPEAGIDIVTLGDLTADPAGRVHPGPGSWGLGKEWHIWTGPQDIADLQGSLAKEALAALDATHPRVERSLTHDQLLRELLLALSSDWAFMVSHDTAAGYARARFDTHARATSAIAAALREGRLNDAARHAARDAERDHPFGSLDARSFLSDTSLV